VAALQIAGLLFVPALAAWRGSRVPSANWLSPIVVTYVLGLLVGNLSPAGWLDAAVTEQVASVAVVLGIPLLLFSTDLRAWVRLAPATALSTGVIFVSVGLATTLTALVFAPRVDEGWKVAGMLAGTFTGSAPNLAAVGSALETRAETITLVVTADLLIAGLYCFLLLTPAVRGVAWLVGGGASVEGQAGPADSPDDPPAPAADLVTGWTWGGAVLASLLALAIAGVGGGAAALAKPYGADQLAAVLTVTTLGIGASLAPRVRALRGSYQVGEYWILVFCFGFGSLADVSRLLASGASAPVALWTTAVIVLAVGLHALAARVLRLDWATVVVTSAAAFAGPALIAPVVSNLRRPDLLLSGITAALVGLAVGTYLGLLVAAGVRACL
jgi:uncharacterized membrane protein